MVLIDCMFVNNGGAKVLLDYLVSSLVASNRCDDVYFLFDERCKGDYDFLDKKIFIRNSLLSRFLFFYRNKKNFTKVFSFGNVPVFFGKNFRKKIVYFHQKLFLVNDLSGLPLMKSKIIFFLRKNVDIWVVQNEDMKKCLIEKYSLNENRVKIIPFYPSINKKYLVAESEKVNNSFIYVSSGANHKNHLNLIEAFCMAYDKNKKGILYLTVDKIFDDLYKLIKEKSDSGYPIVNLGYMQRDNLVSYYAKSDFCIYPSLAESFGLGLIEAMEYGCSVIASDLDYVHNICIPTATFNPYSVIEIFEKIDDALNGKMTSKPTVQLCFNQIEVLEELLFSE